MTWFDDAAPVRIDGFAASGVAVGWLAAGRDYAHGEVQRGFFAKLASLLRNPWQPAVSAGRHPCPFCRFSGGPTSVEVDGSTVVFGTGVVLVPSETRIFIAPSLILHYVDAHDYAPPAEFVAAVEQCPAMRSIDYFKRLRALGGSIKAR